MFSLYKFFEVASLCVWTLEVSSNRIIYGLVLWACGGFLEFAWNLKEIFVILKLSKKKKMEWHYGIGWERMFPLFLSDHFSQK